MKVAILILVSVFLIDYGLAIHQLSHSVSGHKDISEEDAEEICDFG
jgi:hypothetical protein